MMVDDMEIINQDHIDQRAIIFDWGGTLMRVFPQYKGPMASWPEVEEIDGIIDALERLFLRIKMVVGTNANDSTVEMVWKALRRVGLGEYFSAVFTVNELGFAKPDINFYRQIESILARGSHNLIMVGDDYTVDIVGAKTAGWSAIWYNPTCQIAPANLPLHDAQISQMRELPNIIKEHDLPDYPTCLGWLQQNGTSVALLDHVSQVASIAYVLATWLQKAGQPINPVLAHRGGLLHDLAKMESLQAKKMPAENQLDHAAIARTRLLQLGQPELAEIANRHMLHNELDDPRRPVTWEQKLVHFADKLSEGARLVSPEERIEALKMRYPDSASNIGASLPVLIGLQHEICTCLKLTSTELQAKLHKALAMK